MALLSTKLRVPVMVCGVATVGAVALMGGVALADNSPIRANAPFARASAMVNADGTREQSQGIKSLTRAAAGVYCVTFDNATKIIVGRSTPAATLALEAGNTQQPWGESVLLRTGPSTACGMAPDALTVLTGDTTSGLKDLPFFLVVP